MPFINRIRDNLKAILERSGFRITPQQIEADADMLLWMLKFCPACEESLSGHEYAFFAIAIATDENHQRLLDFFKALKEHRWSDARLFNEFDPLCDAAEAKALKCASGQITMLCIRNPVELYADDSLLKYDVLDWQNSTDVNLLIEPEKWRLIQ